MSYNSAKQRITQLAEWLPTLKSQRKKPVRSNDTRQQGNEGFGGISSRDVRIKNGPNGRK